MSVTIERPIQIQCCVCNRVKTTVGWKRSFVEIDTLVSHAYCPRCYAKAMAQIDVELAAINLQAAH